MTCMQKPQEVAFSGMFRGDSDDMVDALVAACQQSRLPVNPRANPLLVGRELQRFSFDDAVPLAKQQQQQQQQQLLKPGGGSPNNVNKRKSVSPGKAHARLSLDGAQEVLARKDSGNVGSNKRAHQPKANKAPTTSVACPSPPAAQRSISTSSTGSPTWTFACPAMFHSPKPEALPMPTMKLMMRAAHACCEPATLPTCTVVA